MLTHEYGRVWEKKKLLQLMIFRFCVGDVLTVLYLVIFTY